MKIELVSKLGARLPEDGGQLEFGATQADTRRQLERVGESPAASTSTSTSAGVPAAVAAPALAWAPASVVSAAFGSGLPPAAWNWRTRVGDRWIEASSGGDGLLGEIRIARAIGAAGIPVMYRGIDLFGHTMAEIEFLLSTTEGGSIHDLRLTGISGYAQSATLTDLTRPNPRA